MKGRGLSKYMTFILRHGAIKEGYKMNDQGYVAVSEFLKKCKTSIEEINDIVATDDKKRFITAEIDGQLHIKAAQGHSIEIGMSDLKLVIDPSEIPTVVHGTNKKAYELIKTSGLNKMGRTHIHFAHGTVNDPTVISGMRRTAEVMIFIDVAKAMLDGIKFYISANGVILSEGINGTIDPKYFFKVEFVKKK